MTSAPALVPTVGGSRNRPLAWFLHGAKGVHTASCLEVATPQKTVASYILGFLSLLTAGLKPTKQLWLTRTVPGCQQLWVCLHAGIGAVICIREFS